MFHCANCLELHQTIYLNKCSYKNSLLNLNKIIEKQEEELEILRIQLRKIKHVLHLQTIYMDKLYCH